MKPSNSFELVLIAVGFGLLASGLGLGLLFSKLDVTASGPAGIVVAILFGLGLCVFLLVALRRTMSVSGLPKTDGDDPLESEQLRRLAKLHVGRANLTISFSAVSTLLAFVLFFGGIPVAFIGFNFATGTNDVGLIIILTGIVVGIIAIGCGLAAIVLGWIAGNASGNFSWFIAALAIPIIQTVAFLFLWQLSQSVF